ncbi:MAG: diacylglycerol/lipid kinase family protein [Thermoplasmata archaeon]
MNGNRRVYVIANPRAGEFSREKLETTMKACKQFSPVSYITRRQGEATEFAAGIEDGSYLIVIGGDGTINEVIQSVINRDITIIPAGGGTGSDLSRTTGILSIHEIVNGILNNETGRIDAMRLECTEGKRYFGNIMEIGFGADVMRRVNLKKKTLMNTFTSAVLHELWGLKNYNLEITFDGGNFDISTGEVIIANCRYFGSGMLASKSSDPTDGLLDLHVIRKITRLDMMRKFSKLRDGSYVDLKDVTNHSSTFFSITGDRAPVEGDGEVFGSTPCTISAELRAIRIMMPQNSQVRKISA